MRRTLLPILFGVTSFVFACSSGRQLAVFQDGGGGKKTPGSDGGPGGGGTVGGDSEGEGFGPDVEIPDAPAKDECRKMDVVFVVDDSGSMAGAQAKLKANFPRMVETLNAFKTKSGTDLDYRLAVTSTDTARVDFTTGGRGGFVTKAGTSAGTSCAVGAMGRAWLERTDVDTPAAFGCRASLGTNGSSTERPIDGLLMSLTDRAADQNKDFLREDALLAFFILTDEEDSSSNTPEAAIAKLDRLKKARGRWAGAVISGQKSGTCNTIDHTAVAAPKLHRLVEGATDPASGKNNVIWRTICQPTFDGAVADALNTFTVACLNIPPIPR